MLISKRNLSIIAIILAIFLVGWFCINPIGYFGYCRFGLTTYSLIPIPISDIQVRSDGRVRRIEKIHDLKIEKVEWLIEPMPNVLIVSTGWDGVVKVSEDIKQIDGCKIHILKTGEAIKLFNKLKGSGLRVSIHIHSTC